MGRGDTGEAGRVEGAEGGSGISAGSRNVEAFGGVGIGVNRCGRTGGPLMTGVLGVSSSWGRVGWTEPLGT